MTTSGPVRKTIAAFTMVDTLVGMALFGVAFMALYAGMAMGYTNLQLARENLRATQILVDKLEMVRLYTWEQLNDPAYVPTTFQATYDPSAPIRTKTTVSPGLTYYGTISINPHPTLGNYSDSMRLIKVALTWTTGNQQRSREMSTLVTYNGLHSTIY